MLAITKTVRSEGRDIAVSVNPPPDESSEAAVATSSPVFIRKRYDLLIKVMIISKME